MSEKRLKTKLSNTARTLLAALFVLACIAQVSLSQETGPGAVIESADGSVLINPPGKVLWEEAGAGQVLYAGTRVRTGRNSQAVISFTGGSYLMVFSVTEVGVEVYEAETGAKSSIFNVMSGKVLMWMDYPKDNEQFIARANNMVMNGKKAKVFIEAEGGEISCVDVVEGSTTLVSMQYPDDFVTLHSNQRIEVASGEPLEAPATFDDIPPEDSLGGHSCFIDAKRKLEEKKKELAAKPGSEFSENLPMSDSVTIDGDEPDSSTSYFTPTYSTDVDTPSYHIVIINAFINVSFVSPEQAAAIQYLSPSSTTAISDAQVSGYSDVSVKYSTTVTFSQPGEEVPSYATEQVVSGEIQFSSPEMETAATTQQEYETITVKKSSSATFADSTEPAEEAATTPVVESAPVEVAPVDSSMAFVPEETSSYETSETTATDQPVEYVEVRVTKSAQVKFEPPAATSSETAATETTTAAEAQAVAETTDSEVSGCTAEPVISGLTAGGISVSEGDAVSIESETICEKDATVELSWTSSVECGTIKSMKIAVSGYESILTVPENTNAVSGAFSVTVGEDPVNVVITTGADNGNATTFSFALEVADITEDPSPYFEAVTVNDIVAAADDSVTVTSYECVDMILDFAGKAVAKCGTVQSVTLEVNSSAVRVQGKELWEATQVFNEEDTYMVELVVKDTYGYESTEYMFDVELLSGIELPAVTIETVASQEITVFGDPITFYRSDLEDRELKIVGAADSGMCTIEKVEISTDGGSSWYAGEGTTYWEYGFRPGEGTIEISARATDDGGRVSEEMMNPVEIEYIAITDEQDLRTVFDRMMQAYRDKDSDTFLQHTYNAFTSSAVSIEDYSRLEQSLEEKFTEQGAVNIRYQVATVLVSGTTGRVTFNWDCNSSSTGYSHTSIFIYTKEADGWKLQTVEDNDIFLRHTEQVAYILDFSASRTTLIGDLHDTSTLSARVLDSAYNPVSNDTPVRFTALPVSGIIETTVYPDAGTVETEYTAGLESSVRTITVTISAGALSKTLTLTINPDFSTIPLPPSE